MVFLITDLDKTSEYQYLKDAYSDIEFKETKYSRNYLQSLIDDYKSSHASETNYSTHIDDRANRAVIRFDKEVPADEQFDENSPLIFETQGHCVVL